MLKGKDMLSIHDLSVDEVQEILALAKELKAKAARRFSSRTVTSSSGEVNPSATRRACSRATSTAS